MDREIDLQTAKPKNEELKKPNRKPYQMMKNQKRHKGKQLMKTMQSLCGQTLEFNQGKKQSCQKS